MAERALNEQPLGFGSTETRRHGERRVSEDPTAHRAFSKRAWWRGIGPLEFLAVQRSLPGLVARRDLLRAPHPADAELSGQLRRGNLVTQLARGSWGASVGWTAWRLGQLHQLGCGLADEPVRRGIDWLYDRQGRDGGFEERTEVVNSYVTVVGDEMPFARQGLDLTAFVLAPLLELGVGAERPVQAALQALRRQYRGGKRCCARCTANVLRALAASPADRESAAAVAGLEWLASIQRSGGWRTAGGAEFYFILDAVGRFDHPAAEGQVRAALPALRRLLQRDGGWGVACRAEKTLTVCRALCRPGVVAQGAAPHVPPRLAAFLDG
jgi:hypothetical protein